MTEQLIYRLDDVVAVVRLSRATIYRLINRDEFPRPVTLTGRLVGWHTAEVNSWLSERCKTKARAH